MSNKFPSLQLKEEDFLPASAEEKESLVIMRKSVNFWADGMRRLRKNKIAMVSLFFIILIIIFAYILPAVWPYSYEQQIKYSENLAPFEYGKAEQELIDSGESVFPHICGTDKLGRDFAVRLMMGTRISLSVGLVCAALVLLVGATYGAIAGFAGGWTDNIMMRITDILYTIPDILLIIILSMAIKPALEDLAARPGFGWMQKMGPNLIAIFLVFVLLYWVGMARITRSQVLILKESEYVTAARLQDREEASSYELYRYIDRNNYAADSFCNFYRELLKLPWTGGCGSYAVFRVSCDRCRKGYEYISASFDPSGGNDQREHIGI